LAEAATSAERSEARASWRQRRESCRVASPLVMAASNAGCALRLQSEGTRCVRGRHYPLLRRGIVPHDTSATSGIDRSGFAALRLRGRTGFRRRPRTRPARPACTLKAHRAFAAATTPCCAGGSATRYVRDLQHRPLRLRCAPPSWAHRVPPAAPSAERSEARASWREGRESCRVASPLVMAASNTPSASSLHAESTPRVRGRHYPLLRRGIVPHDTSATSNIVRSGFAALRLRGRTGFRRRPRTRPARPACTRKAHAAFAAATTPCCAGG